MSCALVKREVEQFRRVESGNEDGEKLVLLCGDGHEAVRRRKHAERAEERMMIAFGAGPQTLHRMLPYHAFAHGQDRIHHGHVDKLTHASAARVV